jgi:hypothetical protein
MNMLVVLLTAALRVTGWLHQSTKEIGFVLEASRTKIRRRRDLRQMKERKP